MSSPRISTPRPGSWPTPASAFFVSGGRLSRHLAAILRWHLQRLRPHVEILTEQGIDLADRLVDIGARDILVVYDFRRYQGNIVYFATQAQARGCKTILVTDRWLSPIADVAEIVFPVPVEAASSFDTMVAALALTEALIGAVTKRSENRLDDRLEAIEHIRSDYRAAFDGPAPQVAAGAKKDLALSTESRGAVRPRPGKRARS
jgi:DNA-binding MurR/RpiR family transcriptional regulator